MVLGLALSPLVTQPVLSTGWVDPLAGIDFALRLQTHRGDGVPVGLFTDAGTTSAGESDSVYTWADELSNSGLSAVQSNAMKRGTLEFLNGIPFLSMDYVDDGYILGSGAQTLSVPYAISILCASAANRPIGRVINASANDFSYNQLMHPRRTGSTSVQHNADYLSTATASDGDFHTLTVAAPLAGNFAVHLDGVDITALTKASASWGSLNLGTEGLYAEAAGADIIAVMVYPPEHRTTVEAYLETLKP